MLSCSSCCVPRWYPPIPTIDTLSPVCQRVRYGIEDSAAFANCFATELTTPAAPTLFRKLRRSMLHLVRLVTSYENTSGPLDAKACARELQSWPLPTHPLPQF